MTVKKKRHDGSLYKQVRKGNPYPLKSTN